MLDRESDWVRRAGAVLPAGTFGNFDGAFLISEGRGSRVWDQEGREYVDMLIGSGPMMLGHGHPEVLEAVAEQLPRGMTFFASNPKGVELAEAIVEAVACAEQVRFVSSGSEADMFAIRLARACTGREKILKFEGGYHGMCGEAQMSLAPEQPENFPRAVPDSAGIPASVEAEVLIAPFNDVESVRSLMAEFGPEIAAIVVEPLQRIVPPEPGFLEALREEADKHGALLVFDEIVTGFRLAYGGAQEVYGVRPDVCTLGKVIGGGFPLAAIAGSAEIMAHFDKASVSRDRWLMQVGTLSGNPVASVAGLKTMEILRRPGQYERLEAAGERLMEIARDSLVRRGIPHQVVGHPSLFEVVFSETPIRNYRDFHGSDLDRWARYNRALVDRRVFKAPGKFYVSLALDDADFAVLEEALEGAADVVAA